MKLTLEKFQEKFFKYVQKEYKDSYIKDGEITIKNGIHEITIPLEELYEEYQTNNDVYEVFQSCQAGVGFLSYHKDKPIDYHNMYPIIRNKDFGAGDNIEIIRKKYFLDLDIIIAEDREFIFWFCSKEDNIDEEKAFEAARFNINKLNNELHQLHSEFKIFSAKHNSDYAASLMLNSNFRKQVREKVGNTFLLAIPSSSGIIVATNQNENIEFMKELIKTDNDPNIVSSHIYRIKGDKWEYAD